MASSSSSSSKVSQKYRVFLSFRGEDTRDNFTSHLYAALCSKKIDTFIDDKLHRGDEISEALLNAIEESKIAVIVFSIGYATSRWCLEELAKIIECKKATYLMVVPVFYHLNPSDVRNQTGTFGEAFVNHEEKQSSEKVMRWRNALNEATNLSGFDSSNITPEAVLIREIVNKILKELNKMSSSENKDLVGMESKREKLESLLCLELKDVCRSVGIWGMGGIGKTTLACALFTKISSHFESAHFQDVREKSEKIGLSCLREELLSAILEDRWALLESTFTKSRLHNKKVLIVFDDVTYSEQIQKLIGDIKCLGPGSRVIITGRDKQVLKTCGVNDGDIYKVEGLPSNESLILFSRHAFKLDHSPIDYLELSIRVIKFAQGVPLALKVLGSSLFEKEKSLWESKLKNLEKYPDPNGEIEEVLKISYNGLDDQEKDIFLDIACFLIGAEINVATEILDGDYVDSKMGVQNLIDKSLITIGTWDPTERTIKMHDLLHKMGEKIVKQESKDPSKRSRLWHHDDIYNVLRRNTGSEAIECISLDISKIKEINLKCNAFLKMQNLRFLDFHCSKMTKIDSWDSFYFYCNCFLRRDWKNENCLYCSVDEEDVNKVHAFQGLEFSPCNIRFFRWFGYPLDSLPSNFEVENLFALIMPWSKIKQLWNGLQHLEKLKHINLIHSKHLIRIPDLSLAPNLESLILQDCTSLIEVHSSIQYLNKLDILNLKDCKNLESLPANIQSKFLLLSGCSKLKKAPKVSCSMKQVYFDGTSITELTLIECPSKLRGLDLEDYSRLESLNVGLGPFLSDLSLYQLDLSDCLIMRLSDNLGNFYSLRMLNLSRNNFEWIPSSFKQLELEDLDISYCERLKYLPLGATTVKAYNCISLESYDFDLFSSVKYVDFGNCLKLDQNMLKATWGRKQWGVFHWGLLGTFLFPGNEIPVCFSFQNVGSSITLEGLPLPLWELSCNLTVCLVVTSQDHTKAPQNLEFCCKVIDIDENGKTLYENGWRLGMIRPKDNRLMSDHVIAWNDPLSFRGRYFLGEKTRYLTFDFSGQSYNVVKCGLYIYDHLRCSEEQVRQHKGDFSSNMEEEPQPKRLKF